MSINPNSFEGGPYLTKQQYLQDQKANAVSEATTTTFGTVKQISHIANLTAAPTESDFNGLLSALAAAGIMAPAS